MWSLGLLQNRRSEGFGLLLFKNVQYPTQMNFFYLPILYLFIKKNVLLKYAYPNLDRNAYVMDAIYLAFVRWVENGNNKRK